MTETADEKAYPGPTLDEWVGYIKAQRERTSGKVAPDNFHLALQAAVLVENLTGDKHWDYYLQCLQGEVEAGKVRVEGYLNSLTSQNLVDQDNIMRLKIALAATMSQIEALEWAIELPRQIKETGKIAQELPSADPAPA